MNLGINLFASLQIIAKNILSQAILQLNRNGRTPKKANHGARPCSSVMRRLRKKQYYKRWRASTPNDVDQLSNND